MRRTDVVRMLEDELSNYDINFMFRRGAIHHYVELENGGATRRISFSANAFGRTALNVRTNLRHALSDLGAKRIKDGQRKKVGSFGEVMIAAGAAPSPRPVISLPELRPEPTPAPIAPLAPIIEQKEEPMDVNVKVNGSGVEKPAKRVHLQQQEVVQVTLLITQNATVDQDKRLVTYNEGWGDERIMEMLKARPGREGIGIQQIREFRRNNFGSLQSELDRAERYAPGSMAKIGDELADLQHRVKALEDLLTAPSGKVRY